MTPAIRLTHRHQQALFALVWSYSSLCCAPEANELSWTVTFAEQLVPDGTIVTAWVAAGGCAASERGHVQELARGATAGGALSLEPGRYGFAAEALNARCEAVAYGCTERSLPADADEPVQVVLSATMGPARCSPQACVAGRCVGVAAIDAGAPIGGRLEDAEAAPPDARVTEAGAAAPPEGGTTSDAEVADAASDGGDAGGAQACPEGVRGPSGHCYRDPMRTLDFLSGRALCAQSGGYLVVLDDASEEAWVVQTFARGQDFWLGLTDVREESEWLREADRGATQRVPQSFFHWDTGNPDGGRNSNCARYRVASSAWRDGSCFDAQRVICELP